MVKNLKRIEKAWLPISQFSGHSWFLNRKSIYNPGSTVKFRKALKCFGRGEEACCQRGCVASPRGTGFADVDAAIEVCKLQVGAAAGDCGVDGLVDLDKVFAAVASTILDDLLRRRSLNLHVEITENLSAIGLKVEVGFQIGGKCNVNVAVQRAEGHGFLGIHARESSQKAPVQGMRYGAARDVVQRDGAIHIVDIQFAVHAGDHDVSTIHGAQFERGVNGNGNSEVDGAHDRIGGDADFVVFFFDGKACGGNHDALQVGIRAR